MRFRAPDWAISAAHFFAPRFGRHAVPDRVHILNRLATAKECPSAPRDEAAVDSHNRIEVSFFLIHQTTTPRYSGRSPSFGV